MIALSVKIGKKDQIQVHNTLAIRGSMQRLRMSMYEDEIPATPYKCLHIRSKMQTLVVGGEGARVHFPQFSSEKIKRHNGIGIKSGLYNLPYTAFGY
jgi:hypothetical protein